MLSSLFPQGVILVFIMLFVMFTFGIILGRVSYTKGNLLASFLVGLIISYVFYITVCKMVFLN